MTIVLYRIFCNNIKFIDNFVLGQSPRHNICAFIELSCYLNCFIKIAYIMLNKYSDNEFCMYI